MTQSQGTTYIYNLLLRIQNIKIGRTFEAKSKGPGGKKWVTHFYRQVYERNHPEKFGGLSQDQKDNLWGSDDIRADYDQEHNENRYLNAGRSRLLVLYDMVRALHKIATVLNKPGLVWCIRDPRASIHAKQARLWISRILQGHIIHRNTDCRYGARGQPARGSRR
jgi:hypothetical protein